MQPQGLGRRAAIVGIEHGLQEEAERVHVSAGCDVAAMSEAAEAHRAAGVDEHVLGSHGTVHDTTQVKVGEMRSECRGAGREHVGRDGCRERSAGERKGQLDVLAVVDDVDEVHRACSGCRTQPPRDLAEPVGVLRWRRSHHDQSAVGTESDGVTGHSVILGRNGMKCNKVHDMQWDRLLDDARADALAEARVRERWLRRQASESATLLGTLLDLAESGAGLSITTRGGRRHDGRLVGLGHDVVLLVERGEHVVIPLGAVILVRPTPGSRVGTATGARAAALDLHFVELLARVVDQQPEVAVALDTGEVLAGSLLAAGEDVLTLRLAPGADGLAYCSAAAVSSARLRSG